MKCKILGYLCFVFWARPFTPLLPALLLLYVRDIPYPPDFPISKPFEIPIMCTTLS